MVINPESMKVIGRINGSSSSRKQKRFATVEAARSAIREWSAKGFDSFWTQMGEGPLIELHPYTVHRDWDDFCPYSWQADRLPTLYHVWAESVHDASDQAEELMLSTPDGSTEYYLTHPTAVFGGFINYAESGR